MSPPPPSQSLAAPAPDHRTVWLYQQTKPGGKPELAPKPARSVKLQKRPPTASVRLVKRRGRPRHLSDASSGPTDGGTFVGSSTAVRSTVDSLSRGPSSATSRTSSKRLRKKATDETIKAVPPVQPQQDAGRVEEVRRSDTTAAGQDSPLLHKPDRPRVVPNRHSSGAQPKHQYESNAPVTRVVPPSTGNSTQQPNVEPTTSYQPYRPPPPGSAAPTANDILTAARPLATAAETTYDREVLPAVIHETRRKEVRHVRHDVLTRSIHEHDIFHRVLPIIEIDKRATRHFMCAADGSLVEIDPAVAQDWRPSPEAVAAGGNNLREPSWLRLDADEQHQGKGEAPARTHRTHVHPVRLGNGQPVDVSKSVRDADISPPPSTTTPHDDAPLKGGALKKLGSSSPPTPPSHGEPMKPTAPDEPLVAWPPTAFAAKGKAPATPPHTKCTRAESPTLWPAARPRSKGNTKGNVGRRSVPRRPKDVVWWEEARA